MVIQYSDWVENIVGKEEIACYEQFLLVPQRFRKKCLLLMCQNEYLWSKGLIPIFHFKGTLKCHLQFVLIWTCLKFLSSGDELNPYYKIFNN